MHQNWRGFVVNIPFFWCFEAVFFCTSRRYAKLQIRSNKKHTHHIVKTHYPTFFLKKKVRNTTNCKLWAATKILISCCRWRIPTHSKTKVETNIAHQKRDPGINHSLRFCVANFWSPIIATLHQEEKNDLGVPRWMGQDPHEFLTAGKGHSPIDPRSPRSRCSL